MVYHERTIAEITDAIMEADQTIKKSLNNERVGLSFDEGIVALGASHLLTRRGKDTFYGMEVSTLTQMKPGKTYRILGRLEVYKLLDSKVEEAQPQSRSTRRFYTPTEVGLEVFGVFQNSKTTRRR